MEMFDDPEHELYVWEKLFTPVMNEHFPVKGKE